MIGYIYKSYCKITHRYYIGCKFSEVFIKDYFGSGNKIKKDIKKFGKSNFTVEILEWVDYKDDKKILLNREKYWCEKYNVALDPNYYNISGSGNAGNTMMGYTLEEKEIYRNKQRNITKSKIDPNGKGMFGRNISLLGKNNPMYGKYQTEHSKQLNREWHLGRKDSIETKDRKREAALKRLNINKPPDMTGRIHVSKGNIKKFIFPSELNDYIAQGFTKGWGSKKEGKNE